MCCVGVVLFLGFSASLSVKRLMHLIPVSHFLQSHISRVDRPCPVLARQCRKKNPPSLGLFGLQELLFHLLLSFHLLFWSLHITVFLIDGFSAFSRPGGGPAGSGGLEDDASGGDGFLYSAPDKLEIVFGPSCKILTTFLACSIGVPSWYR